MNSGTKNKTIVFCFDGTGNEPSDVRNRKRDESITNIYKLHLLLGGGSKQDGAATQTEGGNLQLSYYYPGIGTREDLGKAPFLGGLLAWMQKWVNYNFAPSFGDASRILDDAHRDFLGCNHQPDDKVVIFGFSRGAALARKFASELQRERTGLRISFLGVFDTVAAMNGVHLKGEKTGSKILFENGTLNRNIDKAVHILSLDEDRIPFAPTLINQDLGNPGRILEVWFPGVHTDIGGGNCKDGLSDRALAFMVDRCREHMQGDILITDGWDKAAVAKVLERLDNEFEISVEDILVAPSSSGKLHHHGGLLYRLMAISWQTARREVRVNVDDERDGNLSPLVHFSASDRIQKVKDYHPASLRDLEYTLLCEGGKRLEVKGIDGLRKCSIN